LAEHSLKTKHHVCLEGTNILTNEDRYNKRHIREALEIIKHPNNMKRDGGLEVSSFWHPLINQLKDSGRPSRLGIESLERKITQTITSIQTPSTTLSENGVLNTLAIRAIRISDKEHIKEEIDHLTKVFKRIGYRDKDIRKAMEKKERRTWPHNE
jgi:uncharacterized sporulation protein YeaH/YhbH (DUF444 family)